MRYHIDTIPVWDSLKLQGECLFCALKRRTELQEADRYLGASVMEPDTRIQVNEKGFCRTHHAMLYSMDNRLGHALMLESHNNRTRERLGEQLKSLSRAAHAYAGASMLQRLKKNADADLKKAVQDISTMASTCIMCDSINENMQRYLHTFFHLYQNDSEFKRSFSESKGVCLPHLAELTELAAHELPAAQLADFVDTLCKLTDTNMARMQEDISWFIRKYDYRFAAEPWKNSRDAVSRTVNKLRGWCCGEEPNPKD